MALILLTLLALPIGIAAVEWMAEPDQATFTYLLVGAVFLYGSLL